MDRIMEKVNVKKIVAVGVLIVIFLSSITLVSKYASNPENHTKTITSLDEKKEDVLKLTAVSAAASTALAAIPGEATTPVANKLADLTSYFLIILMVVFVEKYLVTLTGYATFFILIPAACVLFAFGILLDKSFAKVLAVKIAIFGLAIYSIIPISMKVSAMIEETYGTSIEITIKEAEDMTDEINETKDSKGNILVKALNKIKDGVSGFLKKGEDLLNRFIEAIAVMMATSCLIPIIVLISMFWLMRTLFGIQVSIPNNMPKKIASKLPGHRKGSGDKEEIV